jgi:hypothetical protein
MPSVTNPIFKIILFCYKRSRWLERHDTSDRVNPAVCRLKGDLFVVYRIYCRGDISNFHLDKYCIHYVPQLFNRTGRI